MECGWISIHRKIKDHWVWNEKPFSKGQAWIDILLMANHADKKILLGNELIEVKRGSFITSEKKLMENWGWGKEKVRKFLQVLQDDGMIDKKSDHKKTTINVVNYGFFQDGNSQSRPLSDQEQTDNRPSADQEQTDNRPSADQEQTVSRPSADTNNNDNNKNNENNGNNDNKKKGAAKKQKTDYYPLDEKLNQAVLDFVEFRKKIKAPMTEKAIDLMIGKLDKMTTDNNEKIAILEQSIMNGWKGVFPLDKNKQSRGQSTIDEYQRLMQKYADEEANGQEENMLDSLFK